VLERRVRVADRSVPVDHDQVRAFPPSLGVGSQVIRNKRQRHRCGRCAIARDESAAMVDEGSAVLELDDGLQRLLDPVAPLAEMHLAFAMTSVHVMPNLALARHQLHSPAGRVHVHPRPVGIPLDRPHDRARRRPSTPCRRHDREDLEEAIHPARTRRRCHRHRRTLRGPRRA